MNDDKYGGELHPWIEPELEARLVAMVLGEASEFERDELERMMDERPELRIFMRRVQVVHGLLGEAVQADEDDEWRLAPERRAEVMKAIGVAPDVSPEQAEVADQATGEPADQAPEEPVVLPIDEARERRVRRAGLKVALMAAACLMISVLIAPFFMTAGTKSAGVPRSSKADHLGDVDEEGRTDLSFSAQSDRVMRREAPPAPAAPSGGVVMNERLSMNMEGGSFSVTGQGRHSGSDHWDSRLSGGEAQKKLAALKESIGAGRSVDTTSEIEVIRELDVATEYEPPELPNSIVAGEKVVGFPVTPATPTEFGETELVRDDTAVVDGKSELAKAEPAPAPVNRPLANGILPPRTETSVSRSSAKPKVPAPAKPAAPESRMAKVVAATIPAPTAVPVPDVPAVDGVPVMGGVPVTGSLFANKEDAFGTGDDLGDSWWGKSGSGSGGGGMDENGDRSKLSGGVPLRTDLPPETLEGTPAPLGTTGFIAQADMDQTNFDVRKDADGDGLAAAEELGFASGVAGDGQRFGMQLSLGAERQDFGAEEEREDLGRVRGGDMLESLVDGEGESKPRSGELDGRIIEGFAGGADLEERTRRGMTASRSKENARIPGRKSGSQPAGEPAPVVADDDLVWTDPEPSDAPDEGKSVDIEAKHVDVRQANLEELSFDWTVQDAGAKANLKSEADENGRVSRDAPKGLRSGDAAISRNSIDAILDNPEEVPPGILSITGVFSDGREEMIKRRLAEKAAASDTRDLLDRMPADIDYDDAIQGGWNSDLSTYTGYQVGGDAAVGGGSEGGDWSYLDGGQREGLASEITAGKPVDYAFRGRRVSEEDDGFMRGEPNDPIRTNPGVDFQHSQNVDKVRRELYTGEGHYNLGRYDKAQEHFESVLRVDPYNAAARRWMERISSTKSQYYRAAYDETRARMLTEVDKAWEQAVPADEAKKQVVSERGGLAYVRNPLDSIVIPEIDFEDTTVEEALDFLRQRSRELDVSELDPDKKGVNLVLRKARVDGDGGADAELDAEGDLGGADTGSARIGKLKLKNVTLGDALKAIEDEAGLRRRVDDYAVTLLPAGSGEGDDMLTRRWQVPASFVKDLDMLGRDQSGESDPFASDSTGHTGLMARRPMVDVLKDRGISFPEGASAAFIPGTNTLVVKSTPGELERMDQIVEEIGEGSPPVDYMGLYEPLSSAGLLDESEAEDELTMRKLKETRIPVVDFDSVTVEEAVEFIRQHTKGADVDGDSSGIDFAIRKPRVELSDLSDDLELAAAADPGEARIDELKLRNVPASTVLQYVAEQAGLRYQVRNGRVVLMPLAGGEGEDLTTRAWKLHPDVIAQMRKVSAESYNDADDPFADHDQRAQVESSLARMTEEKPLIELMKENGVSFPEGASVAYLPDSQVLVVKNTPSQMDLVDALAEMTAASLAQERQSVKANEKSASEEAFSTFSLHVSDVSFKLAQAALERGEWPDAERIRVEEFVNAFDYGDPAPTQKEQVACQVEQAVHPFMQQRNMLRIAMRTAAVGRAAGTPLRLTILLDHSGSMERTDRVESVQRAFQLLAAQLNPQDEVTLISFARTPRLLRERVKGDQAAELARVIEETPSEGGTNLEEALRLGLEKASEGMQENVQDRIILLTDGAANLGNAKPEELAELVEEMRQKGIAFDACGVGAEGLNDDVLEALTRKGDGRYYFLNRPEDADAGFAKQIAGALRPAAKNVKVQVEFNPKRVGHYRLYGFEKHELKKEDFRNDSVDAAELAAEEAGVAMYQVEPLADGEGDIGTVSVRFQDMNTGEMVEKLWPIPYEVAPSRLEEAVPSMQLAASAAFLGEKLKGTPIGEAVELGELSGLGRELQSVYSSNDRVGQLVDMIEKARSITR